MIYKTAMASPEDLDDEVNEFLSQGFELYGSPYSLGHWAYQALIKKERKDKLDVI